jgi:prenyltransferase beta subunit
MALRLNPDHGAFARRLAIVVALWAALLVCVSSDAFAAAPTPVDQSRLDSTVRYLQDVQNLNGGFGGEPGGESDPDFSAWVALALAAAGINPQDQAQPGGVDVYTYLTEHASELTLTTDFERALLVVDASGTSPYDFGGVNLVSEILGRQLSGSGEEGAFTHEAGESTPHVNDTIFAILALSPIGEPAVQAAIQRAAEWVIEVQNAEGGWPSTTVCPTRATLGSECESSVDVTGAAIEALNAAGLHGTEAQRKASAEAQQKAFAYLHEAQDANGGFPQRAGEPEPNVASTAWAVQAMWSAGENPETWVKNAGEPTDEPLGYLGSMQQPDGHIRYEASKEENGVWMTAMVAPAFAGQQLPIPLVQRGVPSTATSPDSDSVTAVSRGTAQAGQGGESAKPGRGVIAGGGGNGAALFSRPQPQSKGKTPGGKRQLKSTDERTPKKQSPKHRRPASSASTGQEVKGTLLDVRDTEPAAPGLHSAGEGGNQTPWLAVAIAGLIALLFLAGSQLERRRPQALL